MQRIDEELMEVTESDYEGWCAEHNLEPAPDDFIGHYTEWCNGDCGEFACAENYHTISIGDQVVAKYQVQRASNELVNVWRIFIRGFKPKESSKKVNIFHEPEEVLRDMVKGNERFWHQRVTDPVVYRESTGTKRVLTDIEHGITQEEHDATIARREEERRQIIAENKKRKPKKIKVIKRGKKEELTLW